MHIFATYARRDRGAVEALVRDLDRAGHQVWIDNELSGGQAWWDTILSQIRSCDLYLFAVSPDSLRSRACRSELDYAMVVRRPLLPVMIRDVTIAHAPPAIANTHIVDYRVRTVENSIALISAVANRPPAERLTGPLPAAPAPPISYMNRFAESIEAADLSFSEQNHLLADLRGYLGPDDDDRLAALQLLQRLRRRRDVGEGIARQIDQVLAQEGGAPTVAPPTAPRYSNPPPRSAATPPSHFAYAAPAPRFPPPPPLPSPQPPPPPARQPLGAGAFLGLLLLAIFLPLIGLIAGIVLAGHSARRSQSVVLIVVSVICGFIALVLGAAQV